MLNKIKKLIEQYITCYHNKYTVIRKIYAGFKCGYPVYFERRKCELCGREHYSNYYVKVKKEIIYFSKQDIL